MLLSCKDLQDREENHNANAKEEDKAQIRWQGQDHAGEEAEYNADLTGKAHGGTAVIAFPLEELPEGAVTAEGGEEVRDPGEYGICEEIRDKGEKILDRGQEHFQDGLDDAEKAVDQGG